MPRISFSGLLPLTALVLCVGSYAVAFTLTLATLHQHLSATGDLAMGPFVAHIASQGALARLALWVTSNRCENFIAASNLPGMLVERLTALRNAAHESWYPAGLSVHAWRSIVLPFYCLPAWWFIGSGIDALAGRKNLHRATLIAGWVLFAGILTLLLGLRFGLSAADQADVVPWAYPGLILWTILFGILPIGHLVRKWTTSKNSVAA